uniref:Pinin_SDK_memA domain-containing protein n=1 Tax=Strongyloides papillosus TaxID=174720 RepID=A0A0N5CF18_STREA
MTDDLERDLQEAQAELAKLTSKISAINKQKYPSYGKERSTSTIKRKSIDYNNDDYDRSKRRRSRGEGNGVKISWKEKVSELRSQETNDEKARKKRLFSSLLLPNLCPKNNLLETKLKESAEKQKEKLDSIENSLREKKECEIEDLQKQEKELYDKKKEAELLVNKLSLKKAIIEKAERKIANLEGRIKFIQTKTVPKLSFLPAKHTLRTTELLKKSSKNVKDEIEKISYITRYQVNKIENSSSATFKTIARGIEDGTLVPDFNDNNKQFLETAKNDVPMSDESKRNEVADEKDDNKRESSHSEDSNREDTSDEEPSRESDGEGEKSDNCKSDSADESGEEEEIDTIVNDYDKYKNNNKTDKSEELSNDNIKSADVESSNLQPSNNVSEL